MIYCRFIIDGVITLPIALYGFLIFPDLPATTKAFYLTEEARTRLFGCRLASYQYRSSVVLGFRNELWRMIVSSLSRLRSRMRGHLGTLFVVSSEVGGGMLAVYL